MDKRLRDLGSPNEEVDVEWNKRGSMSRDVNTVPTHPPIPLQALAFMTAGLEMASI